MSNATKLIAASALSVWANAAFSHEGHGISGSHHWHASDTWGFVALAVAVGVAIWLSKK
jgi:hypothetical protein